jgi:hypothetical protein
MSKSREGTNDDAPVKKLPTTLHDDDEIYQAAKTEGVCYFF